MQSSALQTVQLGLIGFPLGHSLSPNLHAAALRQCGLTGDYSLFPVSPEDDESLEGLLSRVRSGEIMGLNVTIPHKQKVIPLMDELTHTARSIGAVNTIYVRDGKLIGDNTDAAGFLADLERVLGPLSFSLQRSALVLGAGGSARAVVYALIQSGWNVTVAARRIEQAKKLAEQFGGVEVQEYNLGAFQHSNAQLIVNTTPVGMSPDTNVSPWPDDQPFPKEAVVYDLIYNPRETLLVKQARAAGLQAATGLGMLVEQAALAFELWTGRNVSRAVLFDAVDQTDY